MSTAPFATAHRRTKRLLQTNVLLVAAGAVLLVTTELHLAASTVVCDADDIDLSEVEELIVIPPRCTEVDLHDNPLSSKQVAAIAAGLLDNVAITSVSLRRSSIDSNDAAILAEALKMNTAIKSLDLHDNFIGSAGAGYLAEAFELNTAIGVVDLSDNNIGFSGATALAKALKINKVITSVDLYDNSIGSAGAATLAEALKFNNVITAIGLGYNIVGDEGAVALAEAVKQNAVLTSVDLSDNFLTDTGAAALAVAIKVRSTVTTFNLDGNVRITPEWRAAFFWLVDNAGFRSVSECSGSGIVTQPSGECQCSGSEVLGTGPICAVVVCGVKDVGLAEFQGGEADSLAIRAHCTVVDLHNITLDYDGATALANVLVNTTIITSVGLGSTKIGDREAASLAFAFAVKSAITTVDLSNNFIGDLGAARLAQALETNTFISSIDLRGNMIGDHWMEAFGCHTPASENGTSACSGTGKINSKSSEKASVGNALVSVAVVVTVIVLAGTMLVCLVLQTRRRGASTDASSVATKFLALARERAEVRFVLEYRQLVSAKSMPEFQLQLQQLEVPRSTVKLGTELGRGQSGIVFRGAFCDGGVGLAIKTRGGGGFNVGGAAAAVADEALMLEAMLLNGLRHPGIVTLLAVVTSGTQVLICTELMQNGDLRAHLRRCRPRPPVMGAMGAGTGATVASTGATDTRTGATDTKAGATDTRTLPWVITTQAMIAMTAKLGSALGFIEQQGIIHRDIAARNVLVGKDASDVKLADLGAARNVHRTNELVCNGVYTATTEHTPARWMPLEALREAKFSHKSDVFAFGVLLWEILTFGQTPWGAFGVADFTHALAQGERLKFPSTFGAGKAEARTAHIMYAVAMRCWNDSPAKRPHFHQLEAEFAIHHTVLATTVAVSAPAGVPAVSEPARIQKDANAPRTEGREDIEQRVTVLDADGYVADPGFVQKQDLSLGVDCRSTSANSVVLFGANAGWGLANDAVRTNSRERAQFAESHSQNASAPLSADEHGCTAVSKVDSVANPATSMTSCAGMARMRSLYLGFDESSSSGAVLPSDETRL
jgi:serine/threonine protein kinase/Ran GTPase-activating protein (RanGAP) involved in mRNA processing and transport